jgi:aldose 1-epimerase
VTKRKGQSVGQSIGGIIVGFDQQIFRTTPPVNELVAKGTPLRAVAADGGGTLSVAMPDERTGAEGRAGADDPAPDDPAPSDLATDDPAPSDLATDTLRLAAPGVEVVVDLVHGGRLASVVIDGRELLVTGDRDPFRWGAYPMAPYAGRIRDGRFTFAGRTYRLPIAMPPHAIHGTVLHRPWRRLDDAAIEADLGPDWPFDGRVVQRFDIGSGRLDVRMELHAAESMPASVGWHPWFVRRPMAARAGGSSPDADRAASVELDLDAAAIYARDDAGIATRRKVPPPPGPWDECFTDLRHPPVLRWPGYLELTLGSNGRDWVVYTEPDAAICVEPQSAPPGALGVDAAIVEPGAPLVAEMTWRWRSLAG